MKNRTIIFMLCLSMGLVSNAQTEKGNLFLGTTTSLTGTLSNILRAPNNTIGFGVTTTKYKDEDGNVEDEMKITSFNFAPQIGFFISDGFVGGVNMDYFSFKSTDPDEDGESKLSLFTVGPFLRYYIPMASQKFSPYTHVGASFGKTKDEFTFPGFDGSTENKLLTYTGSLGVAIFLNDRVSVDVQGSYDFFSEKEEDDEISTESSIGLKIGIGVFLSKKGS